MKLENCVAVITGSGKGIGKSIAMKMAREGADIGVLDLDEVSGAATVAEIESLGRKAVFVKTDVSSYESMEQARAKIIETFQKIDILVVNAGISIKHTIGDISVAEWDKVMKINLSGSFYTVKAFYEDFKVKTPEDKGKIVFITSGSGLTGTGGGAHYAASKSGQHGLMKTISKELGKNGVNVNAIAPRVIVTDMFETLYPTEQSQTDLRKLIPIGRFGQPEDIANMAAFLASDEAGYIHGQIILLDGGRTV